MSDESGGEDRQNQSLQNLLWLINDIDQLIEHAMLRRAPLSEAMPRALDRLLNYVSADAVTVRVLDEEGETIEFTRPLGVEPMADHVDHLMTEIETKTSCWEQTSTGMIYAQRLDMSVEFLGGIVAHFEDVHTEWERDHNQRALFHWAEIVDNYVAAVRDATIKQQALQKISDGFKHTILETALDHAIEALHDFVDFQSLAVVCQSDEVLERSTYSYRLIIDEDTAYSSANDVDPRVQHLVDDAVQRLLRQELVDDVLDEIGFRSTRLDDVPIYGLDGQRIVGRIVVGSSQRLTPFESDIVDRFADYLRQRVVDFSREWRGLSRTFGKGVVEELMREPNYRERFLSAREAQVAVLYTDIAGFTRLSEQVLKSPQEIGNLIDRWSRHVVDIIWETGGVFDKMVGDCIIGLWGPPFFRDSAADCCAGALEAAERIRNFTAMLSNDPAFPELLDRGVEISVATGINYCPMFVGLFGPDENFTGFSSGMNNAARLQGLAAGNDIFCMDRFVAELGDDARFGPRQEAAVKNVATPLVYHALTD